MKNTLFQLVILFFLMPISGCFMSDYKPGPKYSAPYGAYFVKPGMTREERLRDLAACGSRNGLIGSYTREDIEKASKATDEFVIGKNNDGASILTRRLRACMASKGYYGVPGGTCSGDQEYFPQCMWP